MGEDDRVTIATFFDPTEARLLCGALEAAGIEASVGDGNTVQTDTLLAIAVKVRVRVRSADVAAAQDVMKALSEGAFALDGEDALPPAPPVSPQPVALFSPDAAAVWSLPLTPLFGTALMLVNAWRDPVAVPRASAVAWFVTALLAATAGATLAFDASRADARALLPLLSAPLVFVWYFAAAQPLSKSLLRRYGSGYRREPTATIGAALLALLLLLRFATS